MINAFARLGDRMLRGVLPTTEAQASCRTKSLGPSEYAICCTNPDSCTLYYFGTELGCSYSAVCG
jgi:hypothetical protein